MPLGPWHLPPGLGQPSMGSRWERQGFCRQNNPAAVRAWAVSGPCPPSGATRGLCTGTTKTGGSNAEGLRGQLGAVGNQWLHLPAAQVVCKRGTSHGGKDEAFSFTAVPTLYPMKQRRSSPRRDPRARGRVSPGLSIPQTCFGDTATPPQRLADPAALWGSAQEPSKFQGLRFAPGASQRRSMLESHGRHRRSGRRSEYLRALRRARRQAS